MQFFKSKVKYDLISIIVFFGFLHLLLLTGCHNISELPPSETFRQTPKTNCLLISIDTLRADHLNCYGYEGIKTPNIDALASEGTLFSKAYTPVPITLPSHSTILTGLFPIAHGVRNNGTFRLQDEHVTLAELFQKAGYRTGAFVGAFVLDTRFGLNQGFDVYDDKLSLNGEEKSVFFYNERPAEKVIESATDWILNNEDDRPFFVWLHCFDPHAPYNPPSPYRDDYADNLYDGEIVYVDMMLGELFSAMKEKGIYDSTLICFTSDHGEGLGEHNEKTHAIFIYDATLHVPLIFRYPQKVASGQVINTEVSLTDIFPTILDLTGINYDISVQGISLFHPKELQERKFEFYCESFYPLYNHKWSPLEGLRTKDWKLIKAPKSELYHIAEDPKELSNLYEKRPDMVKRMEKLMDNSMKKLENIIVSRNARMQIDSDTKERLESLGYIWTTHMDVNDHTSKNYPDPKDMIDLLDYLNRGTYFYTIGEYDKAVEEFKKLLKFSPNDVFTHFVLGYIYDKKGWTDLAINELEEAIRLDSGYINAYNNLGTIYNKLGKRDEAIKYFVKAIELNPQYIEAYDNIGVVYFVKKEYDKAMSYFQQVIDMEPTYSKAYNNIGSIYVAKGDFHSAITPIQKALEYDPNFIDAYNNLGSAYLGIGELEKAMDLFMQTLQLDPNHEEAMINIVTLYIQMEEYDLAQKQIRQILKINPNIPKVYNCMGTLLLKQGRFEEAVDQFKESIYLDPDSFEAYYNLGIVYFSLGKIDEAIREYKRALNIDDKNPGAYVNLGIALFHKGLIDQAINNYKRAKELDTNNVEAMVNLGVAFYNMGLIDQAIEEYKNSIALRPENLQAVINLGLAYFNKGMVDKAIEEYLNVLEINPDYLDARVNLGVAYFNQQLYQEAINQYQEIIKRDPRMFQAYYGIGYSYFMMGAYSEAMQYLREAIRVKPDYSEAYLLLDRTDAMLSLGIRP